MKLEIEVLEEGSVVRAATTDAQPHETVEAVARRLAPELAVNVEELLAELALDDEILKLDATVSDVLKQGPKIRHRRVCVDLHFESESIKHMFAANNRWAAVHRFGCKHFNVASDACANLELHEGSATGSALNDQGRIGLFTGCKTVWLVKPGAEPNG